MKIFILVALLNPLNLLNLAEAANPQHPQHPPHLGHPPAIDWLGGCYVPMCWGNSLNVESLNVNPISAIGLKGEPYRVFNPAIIIITNPAGECANALQSHQPCDDMPHYNPEGVSHGEKANKTHH